MDKVLIYSPWKVSKLRHKGLITACTVKKVTVLLKHDLHVDECDTMMNRHSHQRLPVTAITQTLYRTALATTWYCTHGNFHIVSSKNSELYRTHIISYLYIQICPSLSLWVWIIKRLIYILSCLMPKKTFISVHITYITFLLPVEKLST